MQIPLSWEAEDQYSRLVHQMQLPSKREPQRPGERVGMGGRELVGVGEAVRATPDFSLHWHQFHSREFCPWLELGC